MGDFAGQLAVLAKKSERYQQTKNKVLNDAPK